uniref:Uncharacterized protein n=1 Tax=Glossina morsitans morsitans TaxID=37546 RepID=A0A1B0G8I8_GLOMM
MATESVKCSIAAENEEQLEAVESTEEVTQASDTLSETESETKGQLNEENPVKETQETVNVKSNNEESKSENPTVERVEMSFPDKDKSGPETKVPNTKHKYEEYISYDADGSAIYTDPNTEYRYTWSSVKNTWIPCNEKADADNKTLYENEHYRWCSETQKWLPKQVTQREQVVETEHYKWNAETQAWIPKQLSEKSPSAANEARYDVDEDGQRIYTDKDGSIFFWDTQKSAWFPKIDDEFMARYQMSYGFNDLKENDQNEEETRSAQEVAFTKSEQQTEMDEIKSSGESYEMNKQCSKRKQQQEAPSNLTNNA